MRLDSDLLGQALWNACSYAGVLDIHADGWKELNDIATDTAAEYARLSTAADAVRTNVWPLPAEDESMIREHHLTDQGYERCVICRLLSTVDDAREEVVRLEGLVMVYKPVYEAVRDTPGAADLAASIRKMVAS